jgi:hypothetical protein
LQNYFDNRYWTMWKLPMFGCSDPVQVIALQQPDIALAAGFNGLSVTAMIAMQQQLPMLASSSSQESAPACTCWHASIPAPAGPAAVDAAIVVLDRPFTESGRLQQYSSTSNTFDQQQAY